MGQRGLCLLERGVELRQRAARARYRGGHTRHNAGQIARNGGKGVKRARSLRQRVLTQICLGLAKVGRPGLNCVIDSVAGTRDSRGIICHGARLRGQTVLDTLQLVVLLLERIDRRGDQCVDLIRSRRGIAGKNLQVADNCGVVIDRCLERLERVVDAGGRRCDRARQLADGSIRGSRRLG